MSNDPDLIEQPCPDCNGSGYEIDGTGETRGICDQCDGEGVR